MADERAPGVCSPWVPDSNPHNLAVLGKFVEELSEAGSIVARCIIQGVDEAEPVTGEPNRTALENEIADVLAGADVAIAHFGLDAASIRRRADAKVGHLRRWHSMLVDGRQAVAKDGRSPLPDSGSVAPSAAKTKDDPRTLAASLVRLREYAQPLNVEAIMAAAYDAEQKCDHATRWANHDICSTCVRDVLTQRLSLLLSGISQEEEQGKEPGEDTRAGETAL